jgi:TatA/E family protein of Tat protein translocase
VFGISSSELLIIGIFAFIIFGPDKIPEIARTVSKAVAMFKKTQDDVERTIKAEMYNVDPELSSSLFGAAGLSDKTESPAAKSAASASDASGMQGVVDDEGEDEE